MIVASSDRDDLFYITWLVTELQDFSREELVSSSPRKTKGAFSGLPSNNQ